MQTIYKIIIKIYEKVFILKVNELIRYLSNTFLSIHFLYHCGMS